MQQFLKKYPTHYSKTLVKSLLVFLLFFMLRYGFNDFAYTYV